MNPGSAPRVTLADVNAAIRSESYTVLPDGRTTVCQLTLDNGFTVEGLSACVSKENFNAELGNKYSRERAFNEAWKMLGFRLADQLMTAKHTWVDRLHAEIKELTNRRELLQDFLNSDRCRNLDAKTLGLMNKQLEAMTEYRHALLGRWDHLTGLPNDSKL